jgi:hypothetical protein
VWIAVPWEAQLLNRISGQIKMKIKVIYCISVIFLVISGCIEPYIPNIKDATTDTFVVSGEVTSLPGFQKVTVSLASSIGKPKNIPLSSCILTIEDDLGNSFSMEEYESGKYRVWMDQQYLVPGIAYRLQVKTPSGEHIQSDFDRMPGYSVIDSVYYMRKETYQNNYKEPLKGLQFYVDFHSDDTENRYFRWVAEETWEYHAPYPRVYYFDGSIEKVWPPDYSLQVCWSTSPDGHIFTLSTLNLTSNSYTMFPVQYVDNTTNRLLVKYSVLLHQYSLSPAAFTFWEQLRINSDKQGGLYETQPLPVEGNLHNMSHPDEKVIGFFGASTVTGKRIFVDGINDMNIPDGAYCSPEWIGVGGWLNAQPWEYPVYFIYIDYLTYTLQNTCVDCRAAGGTLVKPEFWPN